MESFYAGAYWGARREDVAACALRAKECLTALDKLDPNFGGWRVGGMSKKAALKNPIIDAASTEILVQILLRGRNRKDVGREVIEDLGFGMSVWNGLSGNDSASLSFHCGMYSATPGLSNAVVLSLPSAVNTESVEFLEKLMRAIVNPWEPEWALVCSSAARSMRDDHRPFLHKALYLKAEMTTPPDLPAEVIVRELGAGRLLFPANSA